MNKPPRILLGVSGGIAAYKAVEVLRDLVTRGADVRVALTRGAREFVAPLTFSVLSKHEVHTEVWEGNAAAVDHVELAQGCDLLLVAPATAHTLGKLANGLADDFLSTYFLAHQGPVLLAPAMESAMWAHAAVRANMERLAARGAVTVGPAEGFLASGREGLGRMADPATIAEAAWRLATGQRRDLEGLRLLVSAGPTREPIDPVRFVSNRSSGKMGFAIATAARDRGARVTLLAGPSGLAAPEGVRVLSFETADDLHALLVREFPECDGLVMAAAVSDFIPESSPGRMHRGDGARTRAAFAGPGHPREPGPVEARADGRRLRSGNRRPRGPRPPEDGIQGRRPDRRQRCRQAGHRVRSRAERGPDPPARRALRARHAPRQGRSGRPDLGRLPRGPRRR